MTIIMRFLAFRPFYTFLCVALCFSMVSCGGSDEQLNSELTVPSARLTDFTFDTIDTDIAFDPGQLGPYAVSVPNSTQTIRFTAQAANDTQVQYITSFASGDVVIGESTQIELEEGENIILILAANAKSSAATQYSFSVRRLSAEASLSALNVFIDGANQALTPEFDASMLEYTLELSPTNCAVQIGARAQSNASTVTINGDVADLANLETIFTPVGETFIAIAVQSEAGDSSTTYNIAMTRPEPTAEQLNTISTLASLNIEGTSFDFDCTTRVVQQTVGGIVAATDTTTSEVALDFTPEREDATVTLITQAVNQSTGALENQDETVLTNGETFQLPVDLGLNFYELRVTPSQGPSTTYSIVLDGVERSITTVSTVQELQQALNTAQPNDEIRVVQGIYTADASLSGVDTAYFYTNQSGTESEPIFISGALNADGAILTGEGAQNRAVLQIDGDYWVVSNLTLQGAQHGIVLNGASNNIVESLAFEGISQHGAVIENGSNNNAINNSTFDTQSSAIVVGADSTRWNAESGGQGELESENTNNQLRANIINTVIDASLIEVNEGAQATVLEFNRFTLTVQADSVSGNAITVQGNDTVIRYNYFEQINGANSNPVIAVMPATLANLDQPYGQDTQIYSNKINQSADQAFISAASGLTVLVDNNSRVDNAELVFMGDAVNTTAFSAPFFQFQTALDPNFCVTVETEAFVASANECNEQDEQGWQITLTDEGFVQLRNRTDTDRLLTQTTGLNNAQQIGLLQTQPDVDSRLQAWVPEVRLNEVRFLSRNATQFGLVAIEPGPNSDTPLFVVSQLNNFGIEANFILRF